LQEKIKGFYLISKDLIPDFSHESQFWSLERKLGDNDKKKKFSLFFAARYFQCSVISRFEYLIKKMLGFLESEKIHGNCEETLKKDL
jgi:hypothetical protein